MIYDALGWEEIGPAVETFVPERVVTDDPTPDKRGWLTWGVWVKCPRVISLVCVKTQALGFVIDATPEEVEAVRREPFQPWIDHARVRFSIYQPAKS